MENYDFRLFKKHVRSRNTVSDTVEVEFRKGSASMFYRTSYKHTFDCFPGSKRKSNRGIPTTKKNNILNLLRVEENRSEVLFCHQIVINDESVDLMCSSG